VKARSDARARADEARMDDGEPRSAAPLTWIAAAFAAAWCVLAAHVGADARWLAAVGRTIVDARALPDRIDFAAVSSTGWHDAPALGQVIFHGLVAAFGDRGLVLAQLLAVAVCLAALAFDFRRADASDGAAAAVVLALVVGAPAAFFVVRAELFSLALFPVLLLLLRSEAQFRSDRIWLAVPLLALWANLHGGVLVGFAALAAYLVLQRGRRAPVESLGLLVAGAGALLATPAGLDSLRYYAGVLEGEAAAQHYGLWARLSPHAPLDVAFAAVAIVLLAAALYRRPPLWEVALAGALVAMTLDAGRNGTWLLLVLATPAASAAGGGRLPVLSRRLALLCCTVAAGIAVVGFTRAPAPGGATDALLARAAAVADGRPILAGPVDAEHLALRGTLIWIGNPLDAFPRDAQRAYLSWLEGGPVPAHVRVVLAQRGADAQRRLARDPGFREVAGDARTVLYAARA